MHACTCLLLDLDGSLVFTEELHLGIHEEILARQGLPLDAEQVATSVGTNDDVAFYSRVVNKYGHSADAATIATWVADKDALTFERFASSPIPMRDHAMEFLQYLQEQGYPYGIVTSTRRPLAEIVFEQAGFKELVPFAICYEDVPTLKPDPAPYHIGLERLGAEAANCLVIEDSLPGIRSAVAAGCTVVACRGLVDEAAIKEAGVETIIESFKELL